MRHAFQVQIVAVLWLATTCVAAQNPAQDYQIKAVFLFNFTQFVEWPARAPADSRRPIVIGILGDDPFGRYLDDTVRGEKVDNRSLTVRRYHRAEEVEGCQVLFISRSEAARMEQILARMNTLGVLTVSDVDDFAQRGGMIRFVTENNRVRLQINTVAAKAAGLIISSKLLRVADVLSPNGAVQ